MKIILFFLLLLVNVSYAFSQISYPNIHFEFYDLNKVKPASVTVYKFALNEDCLIYNEFLSSFDILPDSLITLIETISFNSKGQLTTIENTNLSSKIEYDESNRILNYNTKHQTFEKRINYMYSNKIIELRFFKNNILESFDSLFYDENDLLIEQKKYGNNLSLNQVEHYIFSEETDSILYLTNQDTTAMRIITKVSNKTKIIDDTKFFEKGSISSSRTEYYFDKYNNLVFRIYFLNNMPEMTTHYLYDINSNLKFEFTTDLNGNKLSGFYFKYEL